MQKFKFKLESVLKMKTLLEEQCRNELGQIFVEKKNIEDEMALMNKNISAVYSENEIHLQSGMKASHASLFPQLSSAYQAKIEELKKKMALVDERIENKRVELNEKKAELKLMSNIKEKEFSIWKKTYNKHVDESVEEMLMMWDEGQAQEEKS